MSVEQLKDGRWVCRYPRGKDPLQPDRNKDYFGRGEAGRRAAQARHDELFAKKGLVGPSFRVLADTYLRTKVDTGGISDSAAASTYYHLKSKILPALGKCTAMAITHEMLDTFVAARKKEGVKNTTIHRDLSDVRAILNWAAKRGLIASSPMVGYEMPRRDDAVILPPTHEEAMAIIDNAAPHLVRAILISYYCGLRPGAVELLGLKWQDFDLINRQVFVQSAKKGGLKSRNIPIQDDGFLGQLKEWWKQDRGAKKKPGDHVITYNGAPIKSIKTAWKAAKIRAGITRRIRPYDIRHAFATALLDNGGDLKTVSQMMGHKSIQQTVDTYQHTSKALQQSTISKLPSLFK